MKRGIRDFSVYKSITRKDGKQKVTKSSVKFSHNFKPYILPIGIFCLFILISIFGSIPFNATRYASILPVTESDFSRDIAESVGTESIALMDTDSAKMLGDREIGSLSNLVSQFNVSDSYSQIDFNGKPIKVSALDYAGFFKWINNKNDGIPGYVTVDPVSMSASFRSCSGMKYVPSAFFLEDAYRHIYLKYPTTMFGNLHFEIDEEGNPYYIASVYSREIALFGGKTVTGCIILDPVTGDIDKYELADVPAWADIVFDGDLLCSQYNWYGTLQRGYINSIFSKQGCKRVTSYVATDENDAEPKSDYGYIAKNGDIWIYTGITSVNGDSSNIGFLLANERTGESRYYAIAGADEKSAMVAAEGEVQEKGYQASFPSLINVDDNPTYIMVLKDSGGLVKLYAAVNVEQYNLVTTAATQKECIAKYKALLGISEPESEPEADSTVQLVIAEIKYIVIDGNTYIYLISGDGLLYKAKASAHEEMLLLNEGDTVELSCSGSRILECRKIS
ncbi:MAG: hypothetical protein HUJ66_00845 [Oscillospiraceae bacterium]|nr:hypothetical protein [Oscillospiraceae bacterium]